MSTPGLSSIAALLNYPSFTCVAVHVLPSWMHRSVRFHLDIATSCEPLPMVLNTFFPNCTFPDRDVNYVAAAPLRSTLGIIWPCVLTLIASIYSALHLDVIADTAATSTVPCDCKWCEKPWLYNRICRDTRAVVLGLGIATVALFAPELIVQRTVAEIEWCSSAMRELKGNWKSRWQNVCSDFHLVYFLGIKCEKLLTNSFCFHG
jgi:hypothetical protein